MGHHSSGTSRLRWRRARALLASGLVLGVGGAVTLAAWNDSEHSSANFAASTFGIQGSTDSTTYVEHATSGTAATLPFGLPATAMSPSTTAYAGLQVRTIAGSVAGTAMVTADPGNSAGLGARLRYGVRQLPVGTACSLANYNIAGSVEIVAPNTVLTSNGAGIARPLAPNSSSPINYCFAVTMLANAPTEAQRESVTARWVVTGTSS